MRVRGSILLRAPSSFVLVSIAAIGCGSSGADGAEPGDDAGDSAISSDATALDSTRDDTGGDTATTPDAPVPKLEWTSMPTPDGGSVRAVYGSALDDVWAVGNAGAGGRILHWDGSAWSIAYGLPSPAVDVWAASKRDAWAITEMPGVIWHWDGVAWSKQKTLGVTSVYALFGRSASDVWLGCQWNFGGETPVRHWNGATWSASDTGNDGGVRGLWGGAADDVWAVGAKLQHFVAGTWSIDGSIADSTTAIWGSAKHDVWAATSSAGTIAHFDGAAWATQSTLTGVTLRALHGTSAKDAWAVGSGVLHFGGASWTDASKTPGAPTSGDDVWAASATDVWVARGDTLYHLAPAAPVVDAGPSDSSVDVGGDTSATDATIEVGLDSGPSCATCTEVSTAAFEWWRDLVDDDTNVYWRMNGSSSVNGFWALPKAGGPAKLIRAMSASGVYGLQPYGGALYWEQARSDGIPEWIDRLDVATGTFTTIFDDKSLNMSTPYVDPTSGDIWWANQPDGVRYLPFGATTPTFVLKPSPYDVRFSSSDASYFYGAQFVSGASGGRLFRLSRTTKTIEQFAMTTWVWSLGNDATDLFYLYSGKIYRLDKAAMSATAGTLVADAPGNFVQDGSDVFTYSPSVPGITKTSKTGTVTALSTGTLIPYVITVDPTNVYFVAADPKVTSGPRYHLWKVAR